MNTWFTTALTIALVSAFMEKLNKEAKAISQATPGTYTMPKSIVWLGGICTVFFAVCTVLSMVAGVAMVLLGMYEFWWADGVLGVPDMMLIGLLALICVLVIVKHRSNIVRLCNGTEPKAFSQKSNQQS